MVALASFCPWVPVVGQSGASEASPWVYRYFFADPLTGHYYEVVTSEHLTWAEAEAAAESRTFLGVQGHLATLTSEHESGFVRFEAAWWIFGVGYLDESCCWVGGYQLEGSPEPEGGWQWVTGEPWDYTDWGSGKPDDVTGEEDHLMLCLDPMFMAIRDPNAAFIIVDPPPFMNWEDSVDAPAPYLVEYEAPPLLEVVEAVDAFIQDLPDEAFGRNPRQRRRQLGNQLTQVKRMLSRRNYSGAAKQLGVDILPRAGGGRLGRFGNPLPSRKSEWIVNGDAQQQLGTLIGDLVKACDLQRW
jgi:hypothetical protein